MEYKAFIAKSLGGKDRYLDNAPTFYKTFPHDHKIEINPNVIILETNTYYELLAKIYNSLERNILIVAHGDPEYGLDLIFGTKFTWTFWKIAFWILYYGKVEIIHNRIKYEKNPEKWLVILKYLNIRNYPLESAAEAYFRLMMIDNLTNKTKDELIIEERVNEYKKLPTKTVEEQSYKALTANTIIDIIEQKFKASQEKIWKEYISMEEEDMKLYLEILRKVHTLKLTSLEIRGCGIGENWFLLDMMKLFFNVQHISAPKCWVYYGKARVAIQEKQWFFREAIKQTSRKWLGRHLEPRKWIGGKTTYLSNPEDEERRGIYYHPEGLNRRKDELLFFTFPRIDNINDNRVVLIAENIDMVMNFFEKNFGKINPGEANIFNRYTRRNKMGVIINSRGKYLLLPYCFLDTNPIIFPQNNEFRYHFHWITRQHPDFLFG